jgi:CRISPR/Cas system-associated protein Csx1
MARNILSLTLLLLTTTMSHGQECSDAVFCTINSFKPNNADSKKSTRNQFKIGSFLGSAHNTIAVYVSYLEYNRQLNKKFWI